MVGKLQNAVTGYVLVSDPEHGSPETYHLGGFGDSLWVDKDEAVQTACGLEKHDYRFQWYDVTGDKLTDLRPCERCLQLKQKLLPDKRIVL